ncbi:MAG: hypothetical protein LBR16_05000 [Treponema sp.]|nr:hypothetical protein [Treponema sp.]
MTRPFKGIVCAVLALLGASFCGLVLFRVLQGALKPRTFGSELAALDKLVGRGVDAEGIAEKFLWLEKRAGGLPETLSLLKRRRTLALEGTGYGPDYAAAARAALARYPYAEQIAAVAAEAFALSGSAAELSAAANGLVSPNLTKAAFCARVLAGDFSSPERASRAPGGKALLDEALPLFPLSEPRKSALRIDSLLLRIFEGERGEAVRRAEALAAAEIDPSLRRFTALLLYSEGRPARAAELLASSSSAEDLELRAAALYKAGAQADALEVWEALSDQDDRTIRIRSLYNSAAAAKGEGGQKKALLEALFSLLSEDDLGPYGREAGLHGLIRYSRLLPAAEALAILEESAWRGEALVNLEILRRRTETVPPERAAPEVWLLLGKYPQNEALCRWAAWYFEYQHRYDDLDRLLANAARAGTGGAWLAEYQAIALLRQGRQSEAEALLAEVPAAERSWTVWANTGAAEEYRGAFAGALERYEQAASVLTAGGALRGKGKQAARLQLRIAQCLRALHREGDARRVVRYVLSLDPDNIEAKGLLQRLD